MKKLRLTQVNLSKETQLMKTEEPRLFGWGCIVPFPFIIQETMATEPEGVSHSD